MVSSSAGKKVCFAFCIGLLVAGAFLGAGVIQTKASSASTSRVGVIIPLYTYPTDDSWAAVIKVKQSYPSVPIVAIINPNSGPGSSLDQNYATGITNLENSGVVVLGYVATGYGTSSYSSVANIESQVSHYKSWYPNIQGIFFDEMSNSANEQSYYQTLRNYVNSVGLQMTVGNPGTTVDTGLLGIFNVLCIYENPGIPSISSINQYYSNYGSGGFSYIAYGVSSLPSQSTLQSVDTYVNYIYISNLGGSNPYGALPSYFTNEVAALSSGTTSSITTTTITSTRTSTTASQLATTSLNVKTVLANGRQIFGYYVDLLRNGASVSSSYSPAAFTV